MGEHIVKLPGDPHPFGLHLGLLALGDATRDLGELLPSRSHPLPDSQHDQDAEGHRRDPGRRDVETDDEGRREGEYPG